MIRGLLRRRGRIKKPNGGVNSPTVFNFIGDPMKDIDRCCDIISRYKDFEKLRGADLAFILRVLAFHQNADQKIGCGIKDIWVQKSIFHSRSFWLRREDDSKTDFSFLMCFKKSSNLRDVKAAMRKAIGPSIAYFRHSFFSIVGEHRCIVSGLELNLKNSSVDHEWPETFDKLSNDFLQGHEVIVETGDGFFGCHFKDPELEQAWIIFHNERAKLRVIHTSVNASLGKRGPSDTKTTTG